jgi:hypothetical protein
VAAHPRLRNEGAEMIGQDMSEAPRWEGDIRREKATQGHQNPAPAPAPTPDPQNGPETPERVAKYAAAIQRLLGCKAEAQRGVSTIGEPDRIGCARQHPGDWTDAGCAFAARIARATVAIADAELAANAATITALRAEVERLRRGIWSMCIALGFDYDGDPILRTLVSDIVALGLRVAKDMRESYDEALDELP